MTREKIKSFVNGKKSGGSEALPMSASLLVKFLSISYHKNLSENRTHAIFGFSNASARDAEALH